MPSSSPIRRPRSLAMRMASAMFMPRRGIRGTTSAAPIRGCWPRCTVMSMSSAGPAHGAKGAFDHRPRRAGHGHHGAVVAGVHLGVQNPHTRDAGNRRRDRFHDLGAAALAKVGHALQKRPLDSAPRQGPPHPPGLTSHRPRDAHAAHVPRICLRPVHDDPAGLDDHGDRVRAEAIDQVPVIRYVQHQQVCLVSRRQAPQPISETDGASRVERGRHDGLGRRKPVVPAGQGGDQRHRFAPAGAGVEVRAQGNCHPVVNHRSAVRKAMAPQSHGGSRQQHADHSGLGEPRHLVRCRAGQMVGRDSPELGSQRRPSERRELIGVDLEAQPQPRRCLQHAAGLGHGEGTLLAKDVAKSRCGRPRLASNGGRQHLADHQVHILLVAPGVLRGHGMGPHEGWDQAPPAACRRAGR